MAQFDHGFALLIGVNENKVPGWSLPPVANDIAALKQVLADPERCAYPPDHVKVISGGDATRQGILDGLDWLHDQIQADTSGAATAIILYAGHGWRDAAAQLPAAQSSAQASAQAPAYYLVPYDVRQDNLRSRALRVEDFADAIQALPPCRLLVLLDCGHVGGMSAQDAQPAAAFWDTALPPGLLMGGERAVGPADGVQGWGTLPQNQGRAVLSASQGEQPSYDRPDGRMGIFTGHLIEALSGNAQPQAGANEVFGMDVIRHVWNCVPQSAQAGWGKVQQPDYKASGNFAIGLLRGGKGSAGHPPAPGSLEAPAQAVSYAVNTGGGDFTGRDKTVQGDEVRGDKFSGDKVAGDKVAGDSIKVGDISGNGSAIAIGRNASVTMTRGISGAELDRAFAPFYQTLHDVPPEKQAEAAQKVDALKQEAAKGRQANDSVMAKLLDELVGLVPGMVTAVASTFGTPLLGGIAGPVTAFVVDKIRGTR